MILLATTTDKLQLVTSAATSVDVHVSYIDASSTTLVPSGGGKQNTNISTATTTDILAVPGASTFRNVKTITVRNKDASTANDVTVVYDQNGTDYELFKITLTAGATLEYTDELGFYVPLSSRYDRWLAVTGSDYVNATTSFTDITGLTAPVLNAGRYHFEAMLIHANDASTTGSRFGINGPTLTSIFVSTIDTVTTSVTASAHSAGTVTAVDTAATAQTTGSTSNRLAILTGAFTAGANGTFAMRGASEIAVAAGLTVRVGSWCHVWQPTG